MPDSPASDDRADTTWQDIDVRSVPGSAGGQTERDEPEARGARRRGAISRKPRRRGAPQRGNQGSGPMEQTIAAETGGPGHSPGGDSRGHLPRLLQIDESLIHAAALGFSKTRTGKTMA